ncbi:MAG: zinc dependent phospholipase C family protein [Chloroflexota bacterium]|nr:zinc dependent phospholipase C family protein [Chloroflexota bacterium]MED5449919.1 zinc dependent phospholipase C family protein [Chloroflexota bacterium]|tara:strand:+ start:954 stop:1622 length:669 start_codon:yes stop_codon:yes gene_type:complete
MAIYLFGATAPDIRVITKQDRSVYHFVDLDFDRVGDGIKNMKILHPILNNLNSSDEHTRSFMAGYASHLILDETWITTMFRPFFSNTSLFGNENQGLILDRALQMYLDKSHWNTLDQNLPRIESCEINIEVEFLKNEPIEDWRNWISTLLNRKFSWDRLEFMASRIAKGDNSHPAIGIAQDFISDPEGGIDDILEKLPDGILEEFSSESLKNIDNALGEFTR